MASFNGIKNIKDIKPDEITSFSYYYIEQVVLDNFFTKGFSIIILLKMVVLTKISIREYGIYVLYKKKKLAVISAKKSISVSII